MITFKKYVFMLFCQFKKEAVCVYVSFSSTGVHAHAKQVRVCVCVWVGECQSLRRERKGECVSEFLLSHLLSERAAAAKEEE